MRTLLIVSGQPPRQIGRSGIRRTERDRIGPLTQEQLDEALGLAIGFRRVGSRPNVPDPEHPQRLVEQPRDIG